MTTHATVRSTDGRASSRVPAYGPVDAALGYALLYVVVDHVTPAVVDVVTGALSNVTAGAVRFGLAAFLWFVLVVAVIGQLRRQLAALGLVAADSETDVWAWVGFGPVHPLVSLAAVLVGGLVAAWTFDAALDALASAIRTLGTLDGGVLDARSLDPTALLVLAVFFVSFAVATRALDRLVVDGIRALISTVES